MNNEENARFAASVFDGFKLTKNNVFATCLLPEFDKIIQTSDEFTLPTAAADLEDLRAPIFDIQNDQYFYKSGKSLKVNKLNPSALVNKVSSNVKFFENISDKQVVWSPKGTYLVTIKAEKVVFLGGRELIPIISIPQAKCSHVMMSPCERYVLTYSPMGDVAYSVWDFQLVTKIREFDQVSGEDHDTYQWSHDGNFLAKKFE
jgi:translation initiation factor 3 subunit B